MLFVAFRADEELSNSLFLAESSLSVEVIKRGCVGRARVTDNLVQ